MKLAVRGLAILTLSTLFVLGLSRITLAQPALPEMVTIEDGLIEFPSGVTLIDQTIEIRLDQTGPISIVGKGKARIVMAGPGPAIRVIGNHNGTANPSTVSTKVRLRESGPVVRDLEIIGDHPDSGGIELVGTMQPTIRGVTIRQTHHAIRLSHRNRNVIISDCHLYENSGIGVYYDDVNLHQSNVTGCHISYNRGGGIVILGGDVRNVHITGCDLEENMAVDGKRSRPAANILMRSGIGSIGEVAVTGCTIQHSHEGRNSANIRMNLFSPKRTFASERRHGNVTISGNVISDSQINLDLIHCRGVAITGNTIWKGYRHNIRMADSASVTMTGNMMDRNDRYHYGDGAKAALGVLMERCKLCVLSSNIISGVGDVDAAVDILKSDQISLTANTIVGYPRHAIRLTDVSRDSIAGNIFDEANPDFPTMVRHGKE